MGRRINTDVWGTRRWENLGQRKRQVKVDLESCWAEGAKPWATSFKTAGLSCSLAAGMAPGDLCPPLPLSCVCCDF